MKINPNILSQVDKATFDRALVIYFRIRKIFWVCAYIDGHEPATPQPYSWRCSAAAPPPVPNPQMHWRKPTLFELAWRMARPDLWLHGQDGVRP